MNENLCALNAVINFIENDESNEVNQSSPQSTNKINMEGDDFEEYIKRLFVPEAEKQEPLDKEKNEKIKEANTKLYEKYFSFLGEKNHPPDLIVKEGDAIEVKKIQGTTTTTSSLELNSSPPRAKLFNNDSKISATGRGSDGGDWAEKDNLYILGCKIKNQKKLNYIWFFYGDCHAENNSYQPLNDELSKEIGKILNANPKGEVDEDGNELGRLNKIDSYNATNLRVRGVYMLTNPFIMFYEYFKNDQINYTHLNNVKKGINCQHFSNDDKKEVSFLNTEINNKDTSQTKIKSLLTKRKKLAESYMSGLHFLCRKEKYDSFPHKTREKFEALIGEKQYSGLTKNNIKIMDPDNIDKLIDAVYITYKKS
ncbi:NgoPII family restriction endonuclease [Nitrosomonadales bacterium]|nr:NgoPII family restriction endonuclease [Nitrosomonadales bacterium]